MLLTITTTHNPATDLGYLLFKNPSKFQTFEESFGQIHIFYPEATDEICTVAMLVDINPINLVKKRNANSGFALENYVNDRAYVASSFFSVALSRVFRSAMSGKCDAKPELVDRVISLEAKLSMVYCSGGESLLKKIFEPLGYELEIKNYLLDEKFIEWGKSNYHSVTFKSKCKLKDLLTHLYVLIPVLDDEKHYWIDNNEVEKLLRNGKDWLNNHPEKIFITKRYLQHKERLTKQALNLLIDNFTKDPDLNEIENLIEEKKLEKTISLNEKRMGKVVEILLKHNIKRVLDLGCGEGKLLKILQQNKNFEEIVGVDVTYSSLERAKAKLKTENLPEKLKNKVKLLQSSLTYRDKRLFGYQAATVIEVIEHLDLYRLKAFETVLFKYTRPQLIIITTPNAEYNKKFESLPLGKFRHKDHRFEWTRKEFEIWAKNIASNYGYTIEFFSVGDEDQELGAPTQMGVFKRG